MARRYEARGAVVYDRENDAVVEDYSGIVVLVEAAKRHAQKQADALNRVERDREDIRRMMQSNTGVL